MLNRLAFLCLVLTVLMPTGASARHRHRPKLPPDLPTLYVSKDVMAIRNGQHKATVHFADGIIHLETPYGNYDFLPNIESTRGWVQPAQAIASPKTYRAKDLVTAVVALAVPGDRKMVLRLSAYPGVPGLFIKSGVTGLFGGARDYYFWCWNRSKDTIIMPGKSEPVESKMPAGTARFDKTDWVFFPGDTGGLAVLTNGLVGSQEGQPFINALPRSRFLRPGETLDIGFGLAGVPGASEAAAFSTTARNKHVTILKPFSLTRQTRVDYGSPAPDWLRAVDICREWHSGSADSMNDTPLVMGVPADKEIIAKAREAGARAIVSVDYAALQNSDAHVQPRAIPDDATPEGLLDLALHPEWVNIDSDGNERRCFEDKPGLSSTCFHQADLRQNALIQVLNIMNLGADGVFINNAGPVHECFGPAFGKHSHLDPYETNTDASEALQKLIYKLVKSFGEDKIVMHSSGILPSHWAYCDAQLWEDVRFDERRTEPVNEWAELNYAAQEHADAVRSGKLLLVSSDFTALAADRRTDAALYVYAYTRLYGFLMVDWFDLTKSPDERKLAQAVCSARLGRPVEDVRQCGDMLYRTFENGIVVLNPTPSAAYIAIPTLRTGQLSDVAHDRILTASGGSVQLGMTPESGRVLLWRPD